MLQVLRIFRAFIEFLVIVPCRVGRRLMAAVPFNPRLGPFRHVFTGIGLYVLFAVLLVYVVAPIRGYTGQLMLGDKIGYDAERWLATAIYDPAGNFSGTFDARLDSLQDVNYTDEAIEFGDYVANPDHKSIPVRDVPPHYWQCLSYHEDRHIGGWLNPFGIDLVGVLKIPVSTVAHSIESGRPRLGVGGSTLPMQFARVIYKTPPSSDEGVFGKIRRKLGEWWLAPVIYRELTRGGDDLRLKQWAANHIWLAQRTGGQPLHGVEVTSRVVFGKEAKDLTIAEQFVLASAVNKPIIVLEGSDRLNEVRLDRWRYITEVRARTCAEKLIDDPQQQREVVFELFALAGGPPDPKVRPRLQQALEKYAPEWTKRARANPAIRANVLLPSARYALREEMKQHYGFAWRDYVRGVTTTFDIEENLAFRQQTENKLSQLNEKWQTRLLPGFTLDPKTRSVDNRMPHVALVAADVNGRIVRYYESDQAVPYFGSWPARDRRTGLYDERREGRMIASTGKMLAAIALGNQGRDRPESLYPDPTAPSYGVDNCARAASPVRGQRRARAAFACSINEPLLARTTRAGQSRMRHLIDGFGFTMPPSAVSGPTPPTTAAVLGQISGAPRRVHHMSTVILASLVGRSATAVRAPSLVRKFDYTHKGENGAGQLQPDSISIVPAKLIRNSARPFIREVLQAPLCQTAGRRAIGTLKSLHSWCAARRNDVRLHFAKTGTQSGNNRDSTVDVWVSGGLQFSNGAAYSYVAVIGTGTAQSPFARNLHASQVAAPLVDILLKDLSGHAQKYPRRELLPRRRRPARTPTAEKSGGQATPVASTVSKNGSSNRSASPGEMTLKSLSAY